MADIAEIVVHNTQVVKQKIYICIILCYAKHLIDCIALIGMQFSNIIDLKVVIKWEGKRQ